MSNESAVPAVPSTPVQIPDELKQRVEAAAKVMGLTTDQLWGKLDELGIDKTEEGLSILNAETTTETDAKPVFCTGSNPVNVKIAKFRAGWAVLKGKVKTEIKEGNGVSAIVEALQRVDQMPDEKLLEKYAQQGQDCVDTVLNRLKSITHGRPFVIFDGDNIDIPETLKMLRVARRQDTPSRFLIERGGNKIMVRPAALGEFPNAFVEECPIHGDTILVDGYCDKCQDSWKGISEFSRIIARISTELRAFDVSNLASISNIISLLRSGKGIILPAVKMRYDELKEEDRLPRLRKKTSKSKGEADPFNPSLHRSY